MTQDNRHTGKIPEALTEPLQQLRRSIRRYVLLQGLLFALLFAIAAFWLFAWIDYFPIKLGVAESPLWARSGMLAILGTGSLYLFLRFGIRKWWVRWPIESLALLVERHFPHLEGTLSTTILAAKRATESHEAPDIESLNRLMRSQSQELAIQRIRSVDVQQVLRWKPLHLQATLTGLALILSLLGALWQPAWTWHWLNRFLALQDTPWPRLVELRVEGVEMEVPPFTGETERKRYLLPFDQQLVTVIRGRGAVLRVGANTEAKRVPDYCTVFYQTDSGSAGRANLRRLTGLQDRWQPFLLEGAPFESMNEGIQFSVAAHDLKIGGYRVALVDSPVVASLQLKVAYPTYLQATSGRSYLPETLEYRTGMRLPVGTRMELHGTGTRKLSKVEYAWFVGGDTTNPKRGDIEPESEAFGLGLGELTGSMLVELRLWDDSGLCAERVQQFVINAIPDEVPRVDLQLAGIGSAITPQAILPVTAKVRDDYGVKETGLELNVNEQPSQRFEMQTTSNQDEVLEIAKSLDLKAFAQDGTLKIPIDATVALTVAAEDFASSPEAPHIGRASPLLLAVVSPDKLIILLEKREIAMRARLELIISELQQLRTLLSKLNNPLVVDGDTNTSDEAALEERTGRLRLLRVQQSLMQLSKSRAELDGLQNEIGQIAMELFNNRVDSQDRRERLLSKIQRPIQQTLEGSYPALTQQVKSLESVALQSPFNEAQVADITTRTDGVLAELQDVLKNMIDIQDFNELIDMVRDLADQQQSLLDQTRQEQKRQVRDLFK